MKKIFVLLFALATIVWAETKIEMIVRIENLPEKMFDFDGWNMDPDACSNFNCWWSSTQSLCPTVLDSNVLYGWPYEGECVEFYFLTGATHPWRKVIEDEMDLYRKCLKGEASDSTYNSIFTRIDSILVPEINKRLQDEKKNRILLVYDYRMGWIRQAEIAIPGGGSDLDFIGFATDTVKARNAAISSIAPVKYKLETIRVQNHRLTVAPKLLGRQFTLFDVNGHELRRGILKNNMQLPAYPTVIKIHGFGTQLLK